MASQPQTCRGERTRRQHGHGQRTGQVPCVAEGQQHEQCRGGSLRSQMKTYFPVEGHRQTEQFATGARQHEFAHDHRRRNPRHRSGAEQVADDTDRQRQNPLAPVVDRKRRNTPHRTEQPHREQRNDGQIGRTLRYNTRFCKDKRYMGLKSWITTGDLYSKDFAYGEVPWKLDVFDTETFARSPMKFTVVCTDIETGKPCYQECRMGDRLDVEWMRASASLPLAARPVKLNGRMYLDGGISDPIPVNWMLSQGYEKNVVVCTRHPGYRKEHNKLMPLLRLKFREYPELVKLLDERHIQYNRMLDKIAYLEKEGRIHVIRPDRDISAKPVERDPAHLKEIYEVGRRVMKADMEKLKAYLAE